MQDLVQAPTYIRGQDSSSIRVSLDEIPKSANMAHLTSSSSSWKRQPQKAGGSDYIRRRRRAQATIATGQ